MKPIQLIDPTTGQRYSVHSTGHDGVYTTAPMAPEQAKKYEKASQAGELHYQARIGETQRHYDDLKARVDQKNAVLRLLLAVPCFYKEETAEMLEKLDTVGPPLFAITYSGYTTSPASMVPVPELKLLITADGRLGRIWGGERIHRVDLFWDLIALYAALDKAAARDTSYTWYETMIKATGWQPKTPFYSDCCLKWRRAKTKEIATNISHHEVELEKLRKQLSELEEES